jgi:hypothetical protein
MRMRIRCSIALAATVAAVPALAQTSDPGAWSHELVRRQQSTGGIGAPAMTPPPIRQGPGVFYEDEIRRRQQGAGVQQPPRRAPAPILRDEDRIVQPQRPPDPTPGSSGNRFRTRGGG